MTKDLNIAKNFRDMVDAMACASNQKLFGNINDGYVWLGSKKEHNHPGNGFAIKKVIFSYPATIVLWEDGSKTVVKCQDDELFDPEKGLAMAISKKALGNTGRYYEEFKKWVPEEEAGVTFAGVEYFCDKIRKGLENIEKRINELEIPKLDINYLRGDGE